MSTAELPRPAERIARPRPKRRPARPRAEVRQAATEPGLAEFVEFEVRAIDTEKWPISPVVWWQPDLVLGPPHRSGLRNERKHKTPAAGFLNADVAPVCGAGAVSAPDAVAPALPVRIPRSSLAPIGWDPRTSLGKGIA